MLVKMYSVYDKSAEFYNAPFMARTDAEAVRILETVVNDPKTTLGQHPEQYHLSYMGTFDDNTGAITAPTSPTLVTPVLSLKKAPEPTIQ